MHIPLFNVLGVEIFNILIWYNYFQQKSRKIRIWTQGIQDFGIKLQNKIMSIFSFLLKKKRCIAVEMVKKITECSVFVRKLNKQVLLSEHTDKKCGWEYSYC